MSRAFVTENDGWCFCIGRHEACMYAQEDGTCILDMCKREQGIKAQPLHEKDDKMEADAGAAPRLTRDKN